MDPLSTSALFLQFLAQRRYLNNVTPSTIEWYETAFKALQRELQTPDPLLTKQTLQQFVVGLRQRNVKPVSCNTYIKAINALSLAPRRTPPRGAPRTIAPEGGETCAPNSQR